MKEGSFFKEYFTNYSGKDLLKPAFYFDVYERYAEQFRGKSPHFLEIGIFKGGSLDMWKTYFGEGSHIYGVDIDPATKRFEEFGHTVLLGDQGDYTFLEQLKKDIPSPDMILDDGGHYQHQQIRSFIKLFPHLKDGGVYLVEDVHTSYYPSYSGGYGVYYTFQNFAFQMAHLLNLINIHSSRGCNSATQLTANLMRIFELTPEEGQYLFENIYSIHFYDSMVIFEKREHCRTIEENLVEKQYIAGKE